MTQLINGYNTHFEQLPFGVLIEDEGRKLAVEVDDRADYDDDRLAEEILQANQPLVSLLLPDCSKVSGLPIICLRQQLSNLQTLDLSGTSASASRLRLIATHLGPSLLNLILRSCNQLTYQDASHIIQHTTQLRSLELSVWSTPTAAELVDLTCATPASLTHLDLCATQLDEAHLRALFARWPAHITCAWLDDLAISSTKAWGRLSERIPDGLTVLNRALYVHREWNRPQPKPLTLLETAYRSGTKGCPRTLDGEVLANPGFIVDMLRDLEGPTGQLKPPEKRRRKKLLKAVEDADLNTTQVNTVINAWHAVFTHKKKIPVRLLRIHPDKVYAHVASCETCLNGNLLWLFECAPKTETGYRDALRLLDTIDATQTQGEGQDKAARWKMREEVRQALLSLSEGLELIPDRQTSALFAKKIADIGTGNCFVPLRSRKVPKSVTDDRDLNISLPSDKYDLNDLLRVHAQRRCLFFYILALAIHNDGYEYKLGPTIQEARIPGEAGAEEHAAHSAIIVSLSRRKPGGVWERALYQESLSVHRYLGVLAATIQLPARANNADTLFEGKNTSGGKLRQAACKILNKVANPEDACNPNTAFKLFLEEHVKFLEPFRTASYLRHQYLAVSAVKKYRVRFSKMVRSSLLGNKVNLSSVPKRSGWRLDDLKRTLRALRVACKSPSHRLDRLLLRNRRAADDPPEDDALPALNAQFTQIQQLLEDS